MADSDLLPARGLRGYVLVDDSGIAVGGSLTVLQLAQRGLRSVRMVDSTGVSSGGATMIQLSAKGIRGHCPMTEAGVSTDNGTPYLTLRQRGVNPFVPITPLGVAQGGSATVAALQKAGFPVFVPLNESGNETSVVAAFVGVGDVVAAGWLTWISSGRAFSNATKGGNLVRIRRASDNAEQDFVTLSTGAVDRASIVTFLAATTGFFVTFYDQTGNGRHLTQATAANQAAVNLSGIGTNVTADFTRASSHSYATSAAFTEAPPSSIQAVALSTSGASTVWSGADALNNPALLMGFDAASTATVYNGGDLFAAAADGAWHALVGVVDGASSDMNIDGTANTGNSGGNAGWTADLLILGAFGATTFLDGKFAEGGINSAAISGANSASISTNAHTFWGF